MYRSRFKKIHLTDVQCLEMNNSEEGSKSLRMPVKFTITKTSLLGNHLMPRKNLKRTFSAPEIDLCSRQHTGTEDDIPHDQSVSCGSFVSRPLQNVLDSEASALAGGKISQGFRKASQLYSSNVMDLMPQSTTKVGTTEGFISARQYMNPTHHLCSDDVARKTSRNGSALEVSSTSLSPTRKRSKKTVCQRNNLDNYFKKLAPSNNSSSSSHQISGSQKIEDDVTVSQNYPCRSITSMCSPLSKVPGTNSLDFSPNSSCLRNSTSDLKTGELLSVKEESLWNEDGDFESAIPNFTKSSTGSTSSKGKRLKLDDDKSSSSCDRSSVGGKLSDHGRIKAEPVNVAECKFGLFGFSESELMELAVNTDFEDENVTCGVNYFSRLPLDIVENILCRLPFMDLHLNVNRVCTSWNDIISSPSFMPWKKKYFHLLKADKAVYLDMEEQMRVNNMVTLELYLPSLIRCMKTFKPATGRGGMDELLKRHPKYGLARDLLLERFQDCFLNDQVPNSWCTIATFVVLSESVGDVQRVIRCLLGGQSLCMASELIDGLYCIASFLWMFKSLRLDDVWNGMHYRLYYALYLYEHESVSTVGQLNEVRNQCGQQSLYRYSAADTVLRLTHEQMRICNHRIEPGQTVKIIAFAGTGKTTTLVQYTQMRPNTKFLVVVFNKSVCVHAKTRFPQNVVCRTAHALAHRAVGWKYRNEKKLGSNVKVFDVLNLLQTRKGENLYTQAKFVVETLNGFMASSDPFITTAHVPTQMMKDDGQIHTIDHSVQMHLANDAQNIWDQMIDLRNKSISLPHDGYLKLWQLQKPKIQKFDVILIDEAQDLTPTVTDIFLNQLQPKILVGDPHQQIYSFRGAVNAMNLVTPTHTFYLTQSFRFGPEISFVAASCLELFKKEKMKILVGNGIPGGIYGDRVGQMAIIARSNLQLFCEVVKKCCYSEENIKVSFAGGIEGYGFDMIEDIYYLMAGINLSMIQHPLIKRFVSSGYAELSNFAKRSYDKELSSKLGIVARFTSTIPSHIAHIRKKYVADPDLADVIFTTAHKSKGLEFDTVYLADDFIDAQANADVQSVVEDEYNLLYVAVTRAKWRLIMSMPLLKALDRVGQRFFYPVSTKELLKEECRSKESSDQNLTVTNKAVEGSVTDKPVVTIVKRRLQLSDGVEISSKVFTPESVSEEIHSMRGIAGPVLLN